MTTEENNKKLEGQDAIDLWLQGKDAWNEWAKSNTGCFVSFHKVKLFEFQVKLGSPESNYQISFCEFIFPGDVSFRGVSFGSKGANFQRSEFLGNYVDFEGTDFGVADAESGYGYGYGITSFTNAKFNGSVNFKKAKFYGRALDFNNTKFRGSRLSFKSAQFRVNDLQFLDVIIQSAKANFFLAKFFCGRVRFERCSFGVAGVSFASTEFRNANVSFEGTVFGGGDFCFSNVTFSCTRVSFRKSHFYKGNAMFNAVKFIGVRPDFTGVDFDEVHVDFKNAKFDEKGACFSRARFVNGDLDFKDVDFDSGYIDFERTKFEGGFVNFGGARFGDGGVSFANSEFGRGGASFCSARFRNCKKINFKGMMSNGSVDFSDTNFDSDVVDMSMTSFDASVSFSNSDFCSIPDFTGSKFSHHIMVSEMEIQYPEGNMFFKMKLSYPDGSYAAKLRRLKELAISAKDRKLELEFFAEEQIASRKQKVKKTSPKNKNTELENEGFKEKYFVSSKHEVKEGALFLSYAYQVFSGFGRSVWRPIAWLVFFILSFACAYLSLSTFKCSEYPNAFSKCPVYLDAVFFSLSQSVSFSSWSKKTNSFTESELFRDVERIPYMVHLLATVENIISIVLLSLVVVALRNRFKL